MHLTERNIIMDRIVLEVDSALARAWRNSAPALKAEYERKIADILRELKETAFDTLLEKAGTTAKKKGLTKAKINKILSEEDYTIRNGSKHTNQYILNARRHGEVRTKTCATKRG